eukprot:636572-Amphidinium_carterae.1
MPSVTHISVFPEKRRRITWIVGVRMQRRLVLLEQMFMGSLGNFDHCCVVLALWLATSFPSGEQGVKLADFF